MIDHYDWAGGREAMMRFGPAAGPVVVAVLPLFEEANRTRSFLSGVLRRLAERHIASALPDLPGQGESLVPTENAMLAGWRTALASAATAAAGERPIHILSCRGGALLDHDVKAVSRWQLAPAKGEALVRELLRTSAAAGERIEIDRDLTAADCVRDGAVRVVRLETDPAVADRKVAGAPLWRQSEPGDDPALAELLADDIADWIARCAS
jgi:hypothetical protein